MEKRISPSKYALKYGLISGGVLLFFEFLLFVVGMANNNMIGNVAFAIYIAAVVIAVKTYRDKIQGGYINFGKAVGMGVIVCLIASSLTAIYTYLELKYFSPALMEELLVQVEEKLIQQGKPEEQIEMATAFISPGFTSISYVFGSTLWGTLFSLVIALILKKDENPLDSVSQHPDSLDSDIV